MSVTRAAVERRPAPLLSPAGSAGPAEEVIDWGADCPNEMVSALRVLRAMGCL